MVFPQGLPVGNSEEGNAKALTVGVHHTLNINTHGTCALIQNCKLWAVNKQPIQFISYYLNHK